MNEPKRQCAQCESEMTVDEIMSGDPRYCFACQQEHADDMDADHPQGWCH